MTEGDDAERALGRAVALGLPVAGVVGAVVVGAVASLGSAILVLAATALLSTIGLLWTSVRTLSGDAALPLQMEGAASPARGADAMTDKKRQALRALKDLESDRAVGRIDEDDYRQLAARYREQAKDVMREMEREVAPVRADAERIAREYLKRRGVGGPAVAPPAEGGRVACPACESSNEPDAAFCKGCGAAMKARRAEGPDAKA
jgi:hypothetical protein